MNDILRKSNGSDVVSRARSWHTR